MTDKMLAQLQDNLVTIRQLLGWSAADLARTLDVSKQTISNIENKRAPITKMQYISIRALIEDEIRSRSDEERIYLSNAISLLLDEHDELEPEKKEKAINEAKLLAAATAGGITTAVATATAASMSIGSAALIPTLVAGGIAGPIGIAAVGAATAALWLPKVGKKNVKEKKNDDRKNKNGK